MPIQIGQSHDHGFDQPLELMSDCHRRIEMFLGVLERVTEQADGSKLSDEQRQAMDSALRYFKQAAPLHTQDEEESLFPCLRQSKNAKALELLIRVSHLETEHLAAERRHGDVDFLCRVWLQQNTLPAQQQKRLKQLLAELKSGYAEHIRLEDEVIFPAAAKILSPEELRQIGEEMAQRRGLQTHAER